MNTKKILVILMSIGIVGSASKALAYVQDSTVYMMEDTAQAQDPTQAKLAAQLLPLIGPAGATRNLAAYAGYVSAIEESLFDANNADYATGEKYNAQGALYAMQGFDGTGGKPNYAGASYYMANLFFAKGDAQNSAISATYDPVITAIRNAYYANIGKGSY